MFKSNFERVAELNMIAGNSPHGGWEAADKQMRLIDDEFNKELKLAVADRNVPEVRDGIFDVLVTVYGLACRLGIDADLDFMAGHESNMSKFDLNEQDQYKTRLKYLKLGVDTICRQITIKDVVYYVTVSSCDQTGSDEVFYPAGKFLKSIHFKKPVWPSLANMTIRTLDLDLSLIDKLARRSYENQHGQMRGILTSHRGSHTGAHIEFTRMARDAKVAKMDVHLDLNPDLKGTDKADAAAQLFFHLATDEPGDVLVFVNKVTFWKRVGEKTEDEFTYEFKWVDPQDMTKGVNTFEVTPDGAVSA
jgi:hypothetical protein